MKKSKKEPAKAIIMKKIATLNPKEKAAVSGGRGGYGHGRHHHGEHEEVPVGTVGITKNYIDKDGNVLGGKSWDYKPGEHHRHHKPWTDTGTCPVGGEHGKWWKHHHESTTLKQLIEDYSITHKKLSEAIDKARSHLTELADFKASISQLLEGRELEFETLPKDLDLDYDKE